MSTNTTVELRNELQKVFLNMHKDVEGKRVLKKALLLRFAKPNDKNYDDIRLMQKAAKKSGFKDHRE